MAIASGALVAAGIEGLAVGWITLRIGILSFGAVVWWAMRAPAQKARGHDRGWAFLRHDRFR